MGIETKMLGLLGEAAPSGSAGLHKHAAALIKAVKDGDVEATAAALRGAFLVVDGEPHPEGSHPGESLSSE